MFSFQIIQKKTSLLKILSGTLLVQVYKTTKPTSMKRRLNLCFAKSLLTIEGHNAEPQGNLDPTIIMIFLKYHFLIYLR